MDTKKTKRRIDDETVDRLVENRPVRHVPRKKKKKKKRALSALAVLLSAVLIFVVFFVGSYIYFTATPSSDEPESAPVAPIYKEADKEDDSVVVETEDGDEDFVLELRRIYKSKCNN